MKLLSDNNPFGSIRVEVVFSGFDVQGYKAYFIDSDHMKHSIGDGGLEKTPEEAVKLAVVWADSYVHAKEDLVYARSKQK